MRKAFSVMAAMALAAALAGCGPLSHSIGWDRGPSFKIFSFDSIRQVRRCYLSFILYELE